MKSKEGESGLIESSNNMDKNTEHTILIVDDEKSILSALKRSLADEEYKIVSVDCPQKALDLISASQFSVVISDYSMPGMSGADLLAIVRKKKPNWIRIMLSGAAETESIPDQVADSILNCQWFITKPWDDKELRLTIRKCIQQFETSEQLFSSTQ